MSDYSISYRVVSIHIFINLGRVSHGYWEQSGLLVPKLEGSMFSFDFVVVSRAKTAVNV